MNVCRTYCILSSETYKSVTCWSKASRQQLKCLGIIVTISLYISFYICNYFIPEWSNYGTHKILVLVRHLLKCIKRPEKKGSIRNIQYENIKWHEQLHVLLYFAFAIFGPVNMTGCSVSIWSQTYYIGAPDTHSLVLLRQEQHKCP